MEQLWEMATKIWLITGIFIVISDMTQIMFTFDD